jgi:phosphoglycolate phosphatase-like HAD superfamily hydrolase
MALKHRKCFAPAWVELYNLQACETAAREVWDFVNLFSRTRGCNRFIALIQAMDMLKKRLEQAGDHKTARTLPGMKALETWVQKETRLGNPVLAEAAEAAEAAEISEAAEGRHKSGRKSVRESNELKRALDWSRKVNENVEQVVQQVPPFSGVRESLQNLSAFADIIVVSQTPYEAISREWHQHGLDQFIRLIAGQELGTKAEHLAFGAGGKYASGKVLMIGDAPGDLQAARENGALFYPIIPGEEAASWKRLHTEAAVRFYQGTYTGAYQEALVKEFTAILPEHPAWDSVRDS